MIEFLEQAPLTPAAAVTNWLACYADLARRKTDNPAVRLQRRRAFIAARQRVVILLMHLPGKTFVHGADRITLRFDAIDGHWYPACAPAMAEAG